MNRPSLPRARWASCLAVVVALLPACGQVDTPDVVTFGSRQITREELDASLAATADREFLRATGRPVDSAEGDGKGTYDAGFVADHLTREIYFGLFEQELARRDEAVTGDDRAEAEALVAEQLAAGAQPGEPPPSLDDVPETGRRRLIEEAAIEVKLDALLQEEFTEGEAEAFFERNGDRLAEYCVSHVLVGIEDRSFGEARELAVEARARVLDGEDFADVAGDVSDDAASAEQGGALDCFIPGTDQFVRPFAEVAFALDEGEVSEPVRTEFGWHVITVTEINEASFDELEESIVGAALGLWLAERTADLDVTVDPRYGTWSPSYSVVQPGRVEPPESPVVAGAADEEQQEPLVDEGSGGAG